MTIDLFAVRSLLFLPASNPRAIAKARTLGADLVILDLEDAVKADDKDTARGAAAEALAKPWPMPVAIRINGADSPWHQADRELVATSATDLIVLPKVERAAAGRMTAAIGGKPVLAMIESPKGVLYAREIARAPGVVGLLAGVNDLRDALRLPDDPARTGLGLALQSILLAARAAGIAAFDGVFNGLADPDGLEAECAQGRLLGFDGKSLIHPNQIETCNRVFSPSAEETDRARRLLAAASGGAERFEDSMIEDMHVAAAKRILARAGA